MTVAPHPAPTIPSTDDDATHLFCCDPDRSWCGVDISDDPEVPDADESDDCALCLLAEGSYEACPPAGNPTPEGDPMTMFINTRRAVALALSATLALAAGGCGAKANEPFKDAPRSGNTNTTPADVVTMPDGFTNVASKCDHGNRLYVSYHGDAAYASIAVVPNDPSCAR